MGKQNNLILKYLCYLDLLGTKNVMKFDSGSYYRSLESFQMALIASKGKLIEKSEGNELFPFERLKGKVYFFSDCAFVGTVDLKSMFNFLLSLRDELLISNSGKTAQYFKAAISISENSKGLEADIVKDGIDIHEILYGTKFNKEIGKVYELQDLLKGISIYIDPELRKTQEYKKLKDEYICQSFYLPNINSKQIIFYDDLKFDEDQVNDDTYFKKIIRGYFTSSFKSVRYGRYYISIIATWINSMPNSFFLNISIDKKKLTNAPYVLTYLLNITDSFGVIISKSYGIHYIYFLLLNKIYNSTDGNRNMVSRIILEKMLKIPNLIDFFKEDIDSIPEYIFEKQNKICFIEDYESIILDVKN